MIQPEDRCKNCQQHLLLQQRFCHQCGQRTDTHRINFHYLLHEVPHSIFHIDGGIIFTLRELFSRPGHTIREYLEGKRQSHFKPVMLVLVMGSFCALIQFLLKKESVNKDEAVIVSNLSKSSIARYVDYVGLISYFKEIFHWLSMHFAFAVLLMLPVTAFAFYLGFRKYRINYPEWLVIFLFLSGQSLTVYVPFIFLNHFVANYNWLFFILIWILIAVSLVQFFYDHKKKLVILRTLWSIVLSYFFSFLYLILAVAAVVICGILLYGYDNILPIILKP